MESWSNVMSRPSLRRCFVILVAVAGAACDSGSISTPIQPTPPTMVTETFTGTVGQNGAVTFNFLTQTAGQVTARVSILSDGGIPMGLSLGEWNSFACEIKISNDTALIGPRLPGMCPGPASCVCASTTPAKSRTPTRTR
jgi:hypothetical protein